MNILETKKLAKLLFLNKELKDYKPEETPEWFYLLVERLSQQDNVFKAKCYYNLKTNTDFIKIIQQFMITLLEKNNTYYDTTKYKDVYESTMSIIDLWRTDPAGSQKEKWYAANSVARSVASSAAFAYYSASRSAAYSVANAAANVANAANSAASAYYSAANSAANSVANAAASAANSAANFASNSASRSAASSAVYEEHRKVLLTLIVKW